MKHKLVNGLQLEIESPSSYHFRLNNESSHIDIHFFLTKNNGWAASVLQLNEDQEWEVTQVWGYKSLREIVGCMDIERIERD